MYAPNSSFQRKLDNHSLQETGTFSHTLTRAYGSAFAPTHEVFVSNKCTAGSGLVGVQFTACRGHSSAAHCNWYAVKWNLQCTYISGTNRLEPLQPDIEAIQPEPACLAWIESLPDICQKYTFPATPSLYWRLKTSCRLDKQSGFCACAGQRLELSHLDPCHIRRCSFSVSCIPTPFRYFDKAW